jgi:diguanylate cyclase (GGDEF)-like protein
MSTDATQFDPLSGLFTRKIFEEKLNAAVLLAQQSDAPLSLAFLDIDFFKRANDAFGHEGGDTIIKSVGQAITGVVGERGIVSRYGGEEYIIIFPDLEREQAFLIVEQIRGAIDAKPELSDGEKTVATHITISGGISAYPIDAQDENELLRKADQALYKAKMTGRNKIVLAYEEKMSPKTSHYTQTQLERLSILAKEQGVGEAVLLREALDNLLTKYKHGFPVKR